MVKGRAEIKKVSGMPPEMWGGLLSAGLTSFCRSGVG